jgi:hypothetical protein
MSQSLKIEEAPTPTASTLSNDLINKLNRMFSNQEPPETSIQSSQSDSNSQKLTTTTNSDVIETSKPDSNFQLLDKVLLIK